LIRGHWNQVNNLVYMQIHVLTIPLGLVQLGSLHSVESYKALQDNWWILPIKKNYFSVYIDLNNDFHFIFHAILPPLNNLESTHILYNSYWLIAREISRFNLDRSFLKYWMCGVMWLKFCYNYPWHFRCKILCLFLSIFEFKNSAFQQTTLIQQ
jgi:hypothetical protein